MGSIDEANRVDGSDSVLDIVKKDPSLIPQKYLRSEEERAKDIVDISLKYSSQIPVLDLSLLSNGDKLELEKLDKACEEWGFFQVINHGITEEVLQSIHNGAAEFFKLPVEEKRKYPYDPTTLQGYGIHYTVSSDQVLDWSDSIMFRVCPSHLRKPELWPATPPSFKEAVEIYSAEVKKVAKKLFGSLSFVMGMEKEEGLLELQKELQISMRVNYYPTCSSPDKVLGLSPHSDPSSITILMQNNDTIGLQIRHDGGWVPVKPVPNSLIINVGDALEILSNGKYKSIEHRAVTSETSTRISFGTFVSPDNEVEIEPIKEILNMQQKPATYKKIKYGDYLTTIMGKKMHGKAHVEDYKSRAH
ncbi:hypothetical protein LguiA_016271 [Lonicera macranthoides]